VRTLRIPGAPPGTAAEHPGRRFEVGVQPRARDHGSPVARRVRGRQLRRGDDRPLRRSHQGEGAGRSRTSMTRLRAIALAVLLGVVSFAPVVSGQAETALSEQETSTAARARREALPPDRDAQLEQLRYAVQRLPIAAGLAVVLALRPRRRGTPPRQAQVVQTQIILAIVGSVVMLVVG